MVGVNKKPTFQPLIPACLALWAFSVFSQPLSLGTAIELALKNNDKILQYQERTKEKSYDLNNARGSFLPSVTLTGGYTYMKSPLVIDLDPIRSALLKMESVNQVDFASISSQMQGGPAISDPTSVVYQGAFQQAYSSLDQQIPHFVDTLKKQQYPSAELTAIVPLFTGGRIIAATRAARADRKAADYDLQKISNDVVLETTNNYLAAALLSKVVEVRQDVVAGMLHHCDNAQKLADQGLIAKYHLLRAKVAVSEAQQALFDDRSRLEMAILALAKSMNSKIAAPVVLADTLAFRPMPDSVDSFVAAANKSQPLYGFLREKRKQAHQKAMADRGAMLPQVVAYGKAELFQDYLSALEPPWIVGVNVSVPLFSGGKNIASVQSSMHLEKEVDMLDSAAHHDITLLINKTYHDMRTAQERYRNLEQNQALAAENLRQCQSRFDNGYGTSLEVIDAQLVVEKNKIDRLVSLYDYSKSITELYVAEGNPSVIVDHVHGNGD
jgi:outer membrane protein TolC